MKKLLIGLFSLSTLAFAQDKCPAPNENARSAFAIIEKGEANLCSYLKNHIVAKTAYNEKCENMYYASIRANNLNAFKCLDSIHFGALTAEEVNQKDSKLELSPYEYSLTSGTADTSTLLKKRGGDVGGKELMFAVRNKKTNVAAELIRRGADVNMIDEYNYSQTPLMVASEAGTAEMVEMLIRSGADVQLRDSAGDNAILYSVNNNIEVMKLLITAGADINSVRDKDDNITVLMKAVRTRKIDMVEILIRAGADIHIENSNQWDALSYSIWYGSLETTKLIIKSGAEINDRLTVDRRDLAFPTSVQITKLMLASSHTSYKEALEIMDELIKNGADVNQADSLGLNSLHHLVLGIKFNPSTNQAISVARVKLLLNAGANKNQKTTFDVLEGKLKAGSTPYDFAKYFKLNDEILNLLKP